MRNLLLLFIATSFFFISCDAQQNKIGGNGFVPSDYFEGFPVDPNSINTGWGAPTVYPDLDQDGYLDPKKDLSGTFIVTESFTSVLFRVQVGTQIDQINGGTRPVYEIWEVMVPKAQTMTLKYLDKSVILEKSLAPVGGKRINQVSDTRYQVLQNFVYAKWGC